MANTKEIATQDEGADGYAALLPGSDFDALEVVTTNIGAGGMSVMDLDQVGIPAGGGSAWEVPDLDGTETIKELEGVIVAWKSPRTFYRKSIEETGGGEAPDCWSDDGESGVGEFGPGSEGNPSGKCADCPMNQWGSDLGGGRGKACREHRQLFVLRPGSVLPIVVNLPPTSIKPLRQYMLRLASKGVHYYSVTTKLTLESKSDGGRKWSAVHPALGERLSVEQAAVAHQIGESLKAATA